MMKGKDVVVVLLVCVATITHAEPTVWYVHPDSTLNSIQAALDSCADNDIVLVGPGTYYENIIWPNRRGIHLVSELGPEMTIVDGNSVGRVITIAPTVDTTTVLRGFTIQHGSGDGGGGILCCNSSPVIEGNIITDNHALDTGGGIEIWTGSPVISNNIISDNSATGDMGSGGGIYCEWLTSVIIIGNTITNNFAHGTRPGIGGIKCYTAIIKNNTVSNNWFGGISCYYATVDSCTISNNYGEGVSCNAEDSNSVTINNCDIFGNTGYGVSTYMPTNAEYNWWGDATGPYHATANPGGLGDSVSDYVDFTPWLTEPVGVKETEVIEVERRESSSTIFTGPLQLPEGRNCRVFDITGRVVEPDKMGPGIYFIEIDGRITQKVVKVR